MYGTVIVTARHFTILPLPPVFGRGKSAALSLLGITFTSITLSLSGWVCSKPGLGGRFYLLYGNMLDVHVGRKNVPHHRCGTREGPLTHSFVVPRDFEKEVRQYRSRNALTPLQGIRRVARSGVCFTWALCSTVRAPFSSPVM